LQVFILLTIISIAISFLPIFFKNYRQQVNIESIVWLVVGSLSFSYSIVYSIRAVWFVFSKESEQYSLPEEISAFIAIGGILFSFFIVYKV